MSDAAPPALAGEGQGAMTEAQVMEGIEGLLTTTRPKRDSRHGSLRPGHCRAGRAGGRGARGRKTRCRDRKIRPTREEEEEDYTPRTRHRACRRGRGVRTIKGSSRRIVGTKQDREVFRTLPPEAQAIIARRESEQNAAFTQKTNEIAEHRKALESDVSNRRSRSVRLTRRTCASFWQ